MREEWRARADVEFSRDIVKVWLGRRDDDGFHVALPSTIEFDAPIDPMVAASGDAPPPFLSLPAESAERLLDAIAVVLLGRDVPNLIEEVRRLRRELKSERLRVDQRIEGFSRLPHTSAPASATAPGRLPFSPGGVRE